MLSKALPHSIYELALSARNTTCTGLIFQPEGLHERSELLRGLTTLQVATTAGGAVSTLQAWFRHLERARSMNVAVPDCSLLMDGLDKMINPLLEKYPNLLFRTHSIRMQLQLDTIPNMTSVEQWARSLLAEMETLSVSGDPGPSKRNRVAAVTGRANKEGAPAPKAEAKKLETPSKDACKHWATAAGCRRGRNCGFSHAMDKPGKCWVCGGPHQKADCQAPGGGKGPAPEPKAKGKCTPPVPKEPSPKGGGKAPAAKAHANPSPPPRCLKKLRSCCRAFVCPRCKWVPQRPIFSGEWSKPMALEVLSMEAQLRACARPRKESLIFPKYPFSWQQGSAISM